MKLTLSLMLVLVGNSGVGAFSTNPAPISSAVRLSAESPSPETTTQVETEASASTDDSTTKKDISVSARPSTIYIPLSFDEMVKQASFAMEDAMKAGKKRQMLRILLPRSADSENLGQFLETNVVDPDPSVYTDTVLVPPDETWQGGIMQLYRAASLACQEILRCVVVPCFYTKKDYHLRRERKEVIWNATETDLAYSFSCYFSSTIY